MNPATPFISIPTYDHHLKSWSYTDFQTRDDYKQFVLSVFKEPGRYQFDETSFLFNEHARHLQKHDLYKGNFSPFRSKDFIKFWDAEKEKCRKGAIFKHQGKTWYLTRDYYMWLNF